MQLKPVVVVGVYQETEVGLQAGGGHHVLVLPGKQVPLKVASHGGVVSLVPGLQTGSITADGSSTKSYSFGKICEALPMVEALFILSKPFHAEEKDPTVAGDPVYQPLVIEALQK